MVKCKGKTGQELGLSGQKLLLTNELFVGHTPLTENQGKRQGASFRIWYGLKKLYGADFTEQLLILKAEDVRLPLRNPLIMMHTEMELPKAEVKSQNRDSTCYERKLPRSR